MARLALTAEDGRQYMASGTLTVNIGPYLRGAFGRWQWRMWIGGTLCRLGARILRCRLAWDQEEGVSDGAA